jgi:IMP dehydrogenase/GMP reductase
LDVESVDQSEEEWLKQDYGEVIGTVSSESDDSACEDDTKDDQHRQEKSPVTEELLEGRVIRKQTTPAKPYAPRPKSPLPASKADVIHKETECNCRKRKLVNVAVQTDESKRTVVTRQVKRFRVGDIDMEETKEERVEY